MVSTNTFFGASMKNFSKYLPFFFFHFLDSTISVAQTPSTLTSTDELLKNLENDGLKSGMTIWLRQPLRKYDGYSKISGLTKLTFIDADIAPEFKRIPSSKGQIVISVQDVKEEHTQLVLSTSTLYFPGNFGTVSGKIYTQDPKKITSKWSKRTIKAIEEQSVVSGMTAEQIRTSWGSPNKINSSAGPWGKSEQWIYGDFPDSTYLYLENGKLTSWQN